MKTIVKLMVICFICFSAVHAQEYGNMGIGSGFKVKLISGDVKVLSTAKEYNLQYDYSAVKVGGIDEADYLKQRVEEKNKKEAGTGDKFKESWLNDRPKRFEPKFEELFNKGISSGVKASKDNSKAQYTINIRTDYVEPGYNVGISRRPAFINITYNIVETSNPSNVTAKIVMVNILGQDVMGFDYDAGFRLSEAYAKAGKELAKFLNKNAYK